MKRAKNNYDPSRPLQTIAHASRITGLSQYSIRVGCRNGTIPHVMEGNVYMVHVPLLLKDIETRAKMSTNSGKICA